MLCVKMSTRVVIPDNEAWLHQPAVLAPLQAAEAWAVAHPAQESNLEALDGASMPAASCAA